MKRSLRFRVLAATVLLFVTLVGLGATVLARSRSESSSLPKPAFSGYLEYLESVHLAAPAHDASFVSLLMQQFGVSNRHQEGIAFIDSLFSRHGDALTSLQRARYLAVQGQLRASIASDVPLPRRAAWVNDSVELLESARRLSENEDFLVRWILGVVYSRLPKTFDKYEAALVDLAWCLDHLESAPLPGWERELYFSAALAYRAAGDESQAASYLEASGYDDYDKQAIFVTPYTVSRELGGRMAPESIREVVPGRVYAVSGYEFTEYYFVVSRDGASLISIDAGTRPEASRRVWQALSEEVPDLPPLTHVFFTHAHWDHIGGRSTFRELSPGVQFYARDNYAVELANAFQAPRRFRYFFGTDFDREALLRGYQPDQTVSERTNVEVGGTTFELIPVSGGETEDALFVHLPEEGVLFVGDFIMPYFGSPFAEEGSPTGFYEAVDLIEDLQPREILHGHAPLTLIYNSPHLLAGLSSSLQWLETEVRARMSRGIARSAIHHENLIPPQVLTREDLHLPFLVARENFINRVYDQASGYWGPDLTGMDYLSAAEMGALFGQYLDLSADEVASAVERMLDHGEHELAAKVTEWAQAHYGPSPSLRGARIRAYDKLREKYQSLNPFKFIAYSELIDKEMAPAGPVPEPGG